MFNKKEIFRAQCFVKGITHKVIIPGLLFLFATPLGAVDITLYGYVPEGSRVKKEKTKGKEAYDFSSNYTRGLAVTIDLFGEDGKQVEKKGLIVEEYPASSTHEAVIHLSETPSSNSSKVLKDYKGEWSVGVEKNSSSESKSQTVRLTLAPSE